MDLLVEKIVEAKNRTRLVYCLEYIDLHEDNETKFYFDEVNYWRKYCYDDPTDLIEFLLDLYESDLVESDDRDCLISPCTCPRSGCRETNECVIIMVGPINKLDLYDSVTIKHYKNKTSRRMVKEIIKIQLDKSSIGITINGHYKELVANLRKIEIAEPQNPS
jgi:hypothetical protein